MNRLEALLLLAVEGATVAFGTLFSSNQAELLEIGGAGESAAQGRQQGVSLPPNVGTVERNAEL